MIKKLAKIKEEQGLIAEAADLMQEIAVGAGFSFVCPFTFDLFFLSLVSNGLALQVETFGAMAKTEKIAFILEQVRDYFCLVIIYDEGFLFKKQQQQHC